MCEAPKAMKEIERKAIKEHKCCECNKKIIIGEKYMSISGIWEKPESFKQCKNCHDLMKSATSHNFSIFGDGVSFCGLIDYLLDNYEFNGEDVETSVQDLAHYIHCDFYKLKNLLIPILINKR